MFYLSVPTILRDNHHYLAEQCESDQVVLGIVEDESPQSINLAIFAFFYVNNADPLHHLTMR